MVSRGADFILAMWYGEALLICLKKAVKYDNSKSTLTTFSPFKYLYALP